MADVHFLDMSVDELEATLSPTTNLLLLAKAADKQLGKKADNGESRDAVHSDADRFDAGSPEAGFAAGTGRPRSKGTNRGSLGNAGDGHGLSESTGVGTGRSGRQDDRQPGKMMDDDAGNRSSSRSSSRRPSHRRDRERGYRDSDLEAEDDNVDDERAARFSASSQLKKSAEACPPTSVNGKGATKAMDPGLSRNFKSYAVGTKLGTYDGSTSLETFLARFENCAEYFEWTDADKLYQLRACLEGPAGQLLWSAPKSATVDVIIQLLRNRFGSLHQQERYRAELKSRKRRPNETLQSLYIDISRLMCLAYPGASSPISDIVARDSFLDALNDPVLCVRILEKEPDSLDAALTLACRFEAYDKCAGRAERITPSDNDFVHVKPKYVKAAGAEKAQGQQPASVDVTSGTQLLNQQLKELQQSLERCHAELKSQREEMRAQRSDIETLAYRAAPPRDFNPYANTWGAGQSAAEPAAHAQYRMRTRRFGNCYICNEPGHHARDHKSMNETAPKSATTDGPTSQARGISTAESPADVYLKVKLNGRITFALMDTGCENNICGRRLIPEVNLSPTSQRLFAANGTPVALVGQTVVNINVNGVLITVEVVVSEAVDELILGVPFLRQHACQWDFETSRLSIDGRAARLQSRPSRNQVRRIYAERDVMIPPNHAIEVPVSITRPNLKQSAEQWAIGPKRLGEGVLSARTLISDEAAATFVHAINFSDRRCTVRRGTLIGEAEAVSIVKADETGSDESGLDGILGDGTVTETQTRADGVPAGRNCPTVAGHREERPADVGQSGPTGSGGTGDSTANSAATADLIDLTRPEGEERQVDVDRTTDDDLTEGRCDSAHVDCLIERLPASLTEDQRTRVAKLLRANADVFSRSDEDIGRTHLISHTIQTGDHPPIKESLRRHPQAYVPLIDKFVDDLLRRDLIEPARGSGWAMNLAVAKRSNGQLRYCIDARRVNEISVKDAYALPRIDTCLESLGNSKFFCCLDMTSAYWQVPIEDEASRDRSTFVCRKGLFRWKVMGYGWANAPAVFQRLVDMTIAGLQFETCLAFLDDLIVFGPTFEQTCERLQQVLDRIRSANLKLKVAKCQLFAEQVKFLGFVISKSGVAPDPQKIQSIVRWPRPRNLTELRSWLALCSYNRRHIFQFAEKARALYDLTKKDRKFEWGEPQQTAFERLKTCLSTAPVLASPIDDGQYTLETDASMHSLSSILYQNQEGVNRVICYASRVLQPAERHYSSVRLELLAVVFGLKQFRHFLLCRKFVILTDNAALTSLKRTPEPLAQQARWLDLISEFDFCIVHRSGASNGAADSLSRRPCDRDDINNMCSQCRAKTGMDLESSQIAANESITGIEGHCRVIGSDAGEGGLQAGESGPQSPPTPAPETSSAADASRRDCWVEGDELSPECLKREQADDRAIQRVVNLLTDSSSAADWSALTADELEVQTLFAQRQTLEVRDGVLYRQFQKTDGSLGHLQAVIPRSLRPAVLSRVHGSLLSGHLGKLKCGKRLMKIAYWPGWKTDLSLFIDCCEKCNRFRRNTNTRHGHLKYAGVNAPWQKVHIDLMGPFVKSHDGCSFILTVLCSFTKYLIAIPLRDKSAFSVAKALVRQVFLVYSPVELLVHDNGGEFCNTLLASINQLLDIQSCRVTRYRPSANGVVERSHATLNKLFATSVNENQRNWTDCLPYVAYAYNTAYHSSTTFTPFYLMFLREPRMGVDIMDETCKATEFSSPEDYARVMRERMQSAYQLVHGQLKSVFARAKRRYDVRVRECHVKVGDRVWYFSPRKYRNKSPKWSLQTSGPFEVMRKVNDVNYVVRRSARHPSFVVHIDRLRPYRVPTGDDRSFPQITGRRSNESDVEDRSAGGSKLPPIRQRRMPQRFNDYVR
jgi:predicted aspartyl protease